MTLSNLGLKDECIILSKQLEDLKEYYDTIPDSEKDVRVSEYVQWIKSVLTLTQQLYACKDIQTNGNFINCSIAGESCEIEMRNSKIIGIKVMKYQVKISLNIPKVEV